MYPEETCTLAGFVRVSFPTVTSARQSAPAQRPQIRLCIRLCQSSRSDRWQAVTGPWRGRLQVRVQSVWPVALRILGRSKHKVRRQLLQAWSAQKAQCSCSFTFGQWRTSLPWDTDSTLKQLRQSTSASQSVTSLFSASCTWLPGS